MSPETIESTAEQQLRDFFTQDGIPESVADDVIDIMNSVAANKYVRDEDPEKKYVCADYAKDLLSQLNTLFERHNISATMQLNIVAVHPYRISKADEDEARANQTSLGLEEIVHKGYGHSMILIENALTNDNLLIEPQSSKEKGNLIAQLVKNNPREEITKYIQNRFKGIYKIAKDGRFHFVTTSAKNLLYSGLIS